VSRPMIRVRLSRAERAASARDSRPLANTCALVAHPATNSTRIGRNVSVSVIIPLLLHYSSLIQACRSDLLYLSVLITCMHTCKTLFTFFG